jgi:hypothetical protein
MKLNIKPNLRQFLTNKIKMQKMNIQNNQISKPTYNYMKKINPHTNSNKNIENFSLLKSIKEKDDNKITKLIDNQNIMNTKNEKQVNCNNFNNNSFLKEIQNDCNNFRKSKTTDKTGGTNINLLIGYHENQVNNNNKKIMIKQSTNNMKKLNINVTKIPKYDSSTFKQAMKYYTIKSESKTIQIEELNKYLRPIRNILGFGNLNKIKTPSNISSTINIHDYLLNEKDKANLNNSNIFKKKENFDEERKDNQSIINYEYNIDNENTKNNEDEFEDENNVTFGKNRNMQNNVNFMKKQLLKGKNNSESNISNDINYSLIKNCVFNNNIPYSHRNKFSQIPFSIKIDKIDNTNTVINRNENNFYILKNKTSINNMESTSNNINSKNISEIDTQISTNNNLNNGNPDNKAQQSQSQTLYQFRPRKMHLPKSGINLSKMQFKNQILQNILNKRKKNK